MTTSTGDIAVFSGVELDYFSLVGRRDMEISFSFVCFKPHIRYQIVISKSILYFLHAVKNYFVSPLGFACTIVCQNENTIGALRETRSIHKLTVGSDIYVAVFLKTFIRPIIHPLQDELGCVRLGAPNVAEFGLQRC
jgi:hypothetical protein